MEVQNIYEGENPTPKRKRDHADIDENHEPSKRTRSSSQPVIDWIEDVNTQKNFPSNTAPDFTDEELPVPPADINPLAPLSDVPAIDDMPSKVASDPSSSEDGPGYSDVTNPKDRLKDGSINAYHKDFSTELEQREIFLLQDHDEREPENLDQFIAALRSDRSTPEPDQSAYNDLKIMIHRALDEADVMQDTIPELLHIYAVKKNILLDMPTNSGWKPSAAIPRPALALERLVAPKPDRTLGLSREGWSACKLPTRSDHACPLRKGTCYVPCIAVEAKGLRGSTDVAKLQCLHDGATMVWNLYNLHLGAGGALSNFLHKIKAVTISVTPETLEIYYHWAVMTDRNAFSVCAKKFAAYLLRDRNVDSFNLGRRHARNAIDWMLKETKTSILALNLDRAGPAQAQEKTPPQSLGAQSDTHGKRKAIDGER